MTITLSEVLELVKTFLTWFQTFEWHFWNHVMLYDYLIMSSSKLMVWSQVQSDLLMQFLVFVSNIDIIKLSMCIYWRNGWWFVCQVVSFDAILLAVLGHVITYLCLHPTISCTGIILGKGSANERMCNIVTHPLLIWHLLLSNTGPSFIRNMIVQCKCIGKRGIPHLLLVTFLRTKSL